MNDIQCTFSTNFFYIFIWVVTLAHQWDFDSVEETQLDVDSAPHKVNKKSKAGNSR